MGKVTLDNLAPKMIVGADVRDRSGRLLLGSGTELTERHLYILRTWGVVEVEIDDIEENHPEIKSADAFTPELLESIEKEITPIFMYTDREHPAIKELIRIRIIREAKSGQH